MTRRSGLKRSSVPDRSELARNEDLLAPEWTFEVTGPAHAREFTATISFAGRAQSVRAATKSGAKTLSAAAFVEALFAEADGGGGLGSSEATT